MVSSFSINYISAIFLSTSVLAFVLACITLNKSTIEGIKYFTYMSFFVMIWSLSSSLEYATSDSNLKILFSKFSYLGVTTAPLSLLIFSVLYSGFREKKLSVLLKSLYLCSFLFIVLAFTNEQHFFLWKSYTVKTSIVGQSVFYESGMGVWILVAFSWSAFVTAMFLLANAAKSKHSTYKKQLIMLILAFIIPFLANIAYIFRLLPYSEIDWTPVTYTSTAILIFISIEKYNLFELTPMAKDLLFQSMRNPVIVLNNNLIISDYNPSAKDLFGLQNSVGEDISKYISDIKTETISKENHKNIQIQKNDKSSTCWFDLSISTIYMGKNKAIGHLLLFNDITETKDFQHKITESENQLRVLNASKDKFFSIIAHDLRGPFNGIIGLSEILLADIRHLSTDEISRYIASIHRAGKTGHELLVNLLEWSRMQIGSIEFKAKFIDLRKETTKIIELLENQAYNKNISIELCAPNQVETFADQNMLDTILRNLISNAIKFTPKQGHISIEIEDKEDLIEYRVKDSGLGIKPDIINRLFKIDEKVMQDGTEKEKGTGLGLLLCKEFIEKHKGKIWVQSEEGKGSVFSFTLPKKDKDAELA